MIEVDIRVYLYRDGDLCNPACGFNVGKNNECCSLPCVVDKKPYPILLRFAQDSWMRRPCSLCNKIVKRSRVK